MKRFLRFRMGYHGLPRDEGSWAGPNRVDSMQRACQACSTGAMGDERHMIFECTSVQHLRQRYAGLFHGLPMTVKQFVWQQDIVQVIYFITDCLDVMLQPGPDEEPGIE